MAFSPHEPLARTGGANRYIGSPILRVEDFRFLQGRGEYVDDLKRDGVLHAAILRSSVAHGRIRSIDAAAARALPGVNRVITAAELGATVPRIPIRLLPSPGVERFLQPVIADQKVRYVGEPVAVVLADSAALAEDALATITVDIEPLPVVPNRHVSMTDDIVLLEEAGTNLAKTFTATSGDVEAAFRNAPYTRHEKFRTQRHTALPMEPRGLLAEWDAGLGKLTVFGAAKVLFANRRILAQLIDLPETAIDLIENDVGGGFGARGEFYPEDFLIPFAARLSGRPVKWTEDRRESLQAMNHARDMDCEVEIACDQDGTIIGLRGHIHVDNGAYLRTNGLVPANNVAQSMSGAYRVPNIHLESLVHLTNKTPCGTYRAPGRFESFFFFERLLDLVAEDLGIDRVELRRRNLIRETDMPYRLAHATPAHPGSVTECDSGNYQVTLDRCLAEFNWDEKATLQGKLIDGSYHGIGIGCFIEGGAAGPKETARLMVESDGSIAVYVGSSAVGQGLETVFTQIAADALEIPMSGIRGVFHGSTTLVSEGFGSFASRAVVMGGSAILLAAAELKEKIRAAAAARLGCALAEIQIVDGKAMASAGQSLAFASFAELSAEASFLSSKNTYAYGAHAAHVAVDAKTGQVQVLDYVAVEDVGRIMNPVTMHGQTVGAIVQGLGSTFMEELVYDEHGQLLAGSLVDYALPRADDFPTIRGVTLEMYPSPLNPLGAKGAGEGGIIPVGGVIANAVASALSSLRIQPRELPLSPARIWQWIEAAERAL
jgi:carbon-monoxide dehydrogenase large subunit